MPRKAEQHYFLHRVVEEITRERTSAGCSDRPISACGVLMQRSLCCSIRPAFTCGYASVSISSQLLFHTGSQRDTARAGSRRADRTRNQRDRYRVTRSHAMLLVMKPLAVDLHAPRHEA
jgi:hypothetical protein